jgi:predicted O-methyltransferase YrrM
LTRFLFSATAFILHLIKRKDEHSLHSPFLFDFYTQVVKSKNRFLSVRLEQERAVLLKNQSKISNQDFGAKNGKKLRRVNAIARKSLAPSEQASFLGGIVDYMEPKNIVELGTNLGLTTSYLAEYANDVRILTLEGNEEIAQLAEERFNRLGFKNVKLVRGNFDETLPSVLKETPILDFVFFDGNHRYEPTMRYFEQCLTKVNEQSFFVFHDIYWSGEMAKAWREIRQNPAVMLSIDLYYFGLVFFRQNQPKQHFVLKF